jgi:hypothetical protein
VADIGGGNYAAGGSVTITGGTVIASSPTRAFGGGYGGASSGTHGGQTVNAGYTWQYSKL